MSRRLALGAAAAVLLFPTAAHAHGDPASDYRVAENLFLPYNTTLDERVVAGLNTVLREGDDSGFRIRVAIILTPQDLGTAVSLFRKPQRYAEFLGRELSFAYRGRLLVVMPSGFGYAVNGKPNKRASRVLSRVRDPGRNATKEAEMATVAVRRLASAAGKPITIPKGSGSSDRITIAAAAVAGFAVLAAVLLVRRERKGALGA